jgi:hypothetical protein
VKPKGEENMKLNAPKQITWWIALVLAVVGLIGKLVTISVITTYAFWIVLVAAVLLLLATYLEGL